MSRDGWSTVSGYLRAEEAEMLRGLLESAGIQALVEDAAISALNPLLQSAVGGAKVLVPAADAERAKAIAAGSGLFAGEAEPAAEIPEEEWAAGPAPEAAEPAAGRAAPAVAGQDAADRAADHAFRAAFAGLALAVTLVVPLYAMIGAVRCLARWSACTRRARRRAIWAAGLSAAALAAGLALWGTGFLPPRQAAPDGPARPPAERPSRPFP